MKINIVCNELKLGQKFTGLHKKQKESYLSFCSSNKSIDLLLYQINYFVSHQSLVPPESGPPNLEIPSSTPDLFDEYSFVV